MMADMEVVLSHLDIDVGGNRDGHNHIGVVHMENREEDFGFGRNLGVLVNAVRCVDVAVVRHSFVGILLVL